MLSFDWSEQTEESNTLRHVGIDYLKDRLDIEEIKERILLNLQMGISNTDVMNNHLNFCNRHKIREAIPYIVHLLANPPVYPVYFTKCPTKPQNVLNHN